MRVLQMGPYPPPHGGVQTNLVAIRRFLLSRGIPCAVINLTRYRREDREEIYYPKNVLDVMRLLVRLRYDIIHMHIGGDLSSRLMMLALVCCLLPRSKAVLTFHSGGYPQSEGGKNASPRSFRGFVLRRFDRIIGVNQDLNRMFERFGVPINRIRLIYPHAILPESFETPMPENLAAFFRRHSPKLVTVSGCEPEYDLPLQINALEKIRERFPDAGLMIIGSGSQEAGMRNLIASKPYAEHILLCGDVPHEATLRAIREADIFLRTTLYDGDSISVREALLAGTPVIATDNKMRPAGTHLIPCSDSFALCQMIERILTGTNTNNPQADTGESNIEEVFELYQELVEEMK